MTDTINEDLHLSELLKKAKAATPGPWVADTDSGPNIVWYSEVNSGASVCDGMAHQDADYIAAISPDVCIKLVERINEAEAKLAKIQEIVMS